MSKPIPLFAAGRLGVLLDEIDDWCGTKPPRPFPPRPHKVRDALVAVAVHNLAARLSEPKVRMQIQTLAEKVYDHAGGEIPG